MSKSLKELIINASSWMAKIQNVISPKERQDWIKLEKQKGRRAVRPNILRGKGEKSYIYDVSRKSIWWQRQGRETLGVCKQGTNGRLQLKMREKASKGKNITRSEMNLQCFSSLLEKSLNNQPVMMKLLILLASWLAPAGCGIIHQAMKVDEEKRLSQMAKVLKP